MSDIQQPSGAGSSSVIRNVVLAVAVIYVAASLYLIYDMRERLTSLESKQVAAEEKLGTKIAATQSELKAQTGALASQVGMTQKQLEQRAAELQRQHRAAQSEIAATKAEQAKTAQQVTAVAGELTGVRGEVGGVKSDVASTKNELEATKRKLDQTIGDLGIQSGLIARTREDLDFLRRRGDRDYYEFTLRKSKQNTQIASVGLRLKKTDAKRGRYTLDVLSDDKTIEKKDRNMNEPVQFYTGKDRQLYELVVNAVDKDVVSGYIATPKH
jgi:chromosome segregation ATPase